jgi:hypothetical protein
MADVIADKVAIQPYKPKPLRGRPRLTDFTNHWEPDIVRFKTGTAEWTVHHVSDYGIHLVRTTNQNRVVRRTLPRRDQHLLEIIYQPPRTADTTLAAYFRDRILSA